MIRNLTTYPLEKWEKRFLAVCVLTVILIAAI